MIYSIQEIEGLDREVVDRLRQVGIEDTDQFLDRAATPSTRLALVQQSGVPADTLSYLATLADLLRVKGIGLKLARLLALSGQIPNVQSLAASDSAALTETLTARNREQLVLKRPPTARMIVQIIAEARELKPRLFLRVPSSNEFAPRFSIVYTKKKLTSLSLLLSSQVLALLFTLVVVGLTIGWLYFGFRQVACQWLNSCAGDALSNLFALAFWARFRLLAFAITSAGIIFLLACLAAGLALFLWDIWANGSLARRFFRHPQSQQVFLDLEEPRLKLAGFAVRIAAVLVALTFGSVVAVVVFVISREPLSVAWEGIVTALIYIGSLLLVLIIYIPDVYQAYREHRNGKGIRPRAIQQYLFWRLIVISGSMTLLIALLSIALPGLHSLYRRVLQAWVVPAYTARITEIREQVEAQSVMLLLNPTNYIRKQLFLHEVDENFLGWPVELVHFEIRAGEPLEVAYYDDVGRLMVWSLTAIFIAYFVIPLLFLGKRLQPLLLLATIGFSYFLEEILISYVPALFHLVRGAVENIPLIVMLVLVVGLITEWGIKEIEPGDGWCPSCSHETEAADLYCSSCGFPLPAKLTAPHSQSG